MGRTAPILRYESSSGAPDEEDALLVKGQHWIVIDLRTEGVVGPNVDDGPRIFETKAQDHVLEDGDERSAD